MGKEVSLNLPIQRARRWVREGQETKRPVQRAVCGDKSPALPPSRPSGESPASAIVHRPCRIGAASLTYPGISCMVNYHIIYLSDNIGAAWSKCFIHCNVRIFL